jgi:hypothetical protein
VYGECVVSVGLCLGKVIRVVRVLGVFGECVAKVEMSLSLLRVRAEE